MQLSQIVRIVLLIGLVLLAQFQLSIGEQKQTEFVENGSNNVVLPDNEKYLLTPSDFERPLPLDNRTAPRTEMDWAVKYLRLPTWSAGYQSCEDSQEVSCFEVVRAAKAVDAWEKRVSQGETRGRVFVHLNQGIPYADRLSMLYHGIQIAMATNRGLVTDHSLLAPAVLPKCIGNSKNDEGGVSLPGDYRFGCADISARFPDLKIGGYSWPQVLYTHHGVAPFLREKFGYHAAYFLGNWLFGTADRPPNECFSGAEVVLQGWKLANDDMAPIRDYYGYMSRCGVDTKLTDLVSNDPNGGIRSEYYKSVSFFSEDPTSSLCAMRKVVSGRRISHTFGSRLGWWANALQGAKGSIINGIDRLCTNLTNSQQGSLWHTYCPNEKSGYIFRTNSRFYVCGPNVNDARLYLDYLLW